MSATQQTTPPDTRLHALEQELSEFAYIVSHDLSASFRHIRCFSELLKQDAGAAFTPEQAAWCAQIQTAAEKCTGMLEQLLVFSRLLRQPLTLADCDLAAMLDTVRLQLGSEIRGSGAQILGGASGQVRVDKVLFLQALRPLLDNAIKFRREGMAPVVMVEFAQDDTETRIRLIDNGIGLPDVDPERLFKMFYRGHPEGAYAGCGAGLTIARRLVRRHGGDVRFVPVQDGACAQIVLPRDGAA
jgi:signal transduction histidine kinase